MFILKGLGGGDKYNENKQLNLVWNVQKIVNL